MNKHRVAAVKDLLSRRGELTMASLSDISRVTLEGLKRVATELHEGTTDNPENKASGDAMTLGSYSLIATEFARYEDWLYPWLGLVEETGELVKANAKRLRGDSRKDAEAYNAKYGGNYVKSEIGDIMWMLNEIVLQEGLTWSDILQYNLEKLTDRLQNDTINGDGDNR